MAGADLPEAALALTSNPDPCLGGRRSWAGGAGSVGLRLDPFCFIEFWASSQAFRKPRSPYGLIGAQLAICAHRRGCDSLRAAETRDFQERVLASFSGWDYDLPFLLRLYVCAENPGNAVLSCLGNLPTGPAETHRPGLFSERQTMGTKKKGRLTAPARAFGVIAASALSLGALVIPGGNSAHADPATGNETTRGTADSQRTVSIGGIVSSGLGGIVAPGASDAKATPSAKQSAAGKKAGTATSAASKPGAGARPVASAGTTAPARAKAPAKAAASAPTAAASTASGNRPAATAKNKPAEATGEFTVVKSVFSAPNFVAPSTFTVNYVCRNAAGATTKEDALKLTPGVPVRVADVPEGTCTMTEQDASVPNAYWRYDIVASTSPAPRPPGGRSPQSVPQAGQSNKAQQSTDFPIVANQPVGVRVNNFYRPYSGVVSISKEVLGDGAKLAPATFEYEYSCTDNDGKVLSSGTVKVEPGKEVKIDKLGGDRCKVTEKDASVTGATLAVEMSQERKCKAPPPGQAPQSRPASVAKTASSASAKRASASKAASRASSAKKAEVDVTARSIEFNFPVGPAPCEIHVKAKNTYTMDYASFSVAKKIEAPEGLNLSTKKFVFGYTCKPTGEDEVKGKLEVSGDGTATPLGKQLPVGTSCTVTEDETSAQNGDYTVKIAEPQTFTLEEKDAVKALTFTNVYTKPAPSPSPTPSPSDAPSPTPSVTSTPSPSTTPSVTPSATPSKPVADPSKPVAEPSKPVPPMSKAGKPVPPKAAKSMAPKVEQKAANRGKSLPNTGASVAGMAAVALIAAAGGILILRRKKA